MNIKLINFSAATIIAKNTKVRGITGTAYYIAPEVIDREYNEKCDLWSCGVILYMLLSSYPPFDGSNDKEILNNVMQSSHSFKDPVWGPISLSAKDLIYKLLCPENIRLSAGDALAHPWILEFASPQRPNTTNMISVFTNLKSFFNSNKLRDAVQTFIATQCISAHDTKKLTEAFKAIDTNGDGKLSKEELLSHYIKAIGYENAEEEVDKIMSSVDTDNNGFINYTEFLKAAVSERVLLSSENLRRAFDLFDQDKSGTISAEELKKILQGGLISDDQVWKEIINSVNKNQNAEIDLREFEEIITSKL